LTGPNHDLLKATVAAPHVHTSVVP